MTQTMAQKAFLILIAALFLGTALVGGWLLLQRLPSNRVLAPVNRQITPKTKTSITEKTPITELIQKIKNEKNRHAKKQLLEQLFEAVPTSDVDFLAIMQGDADVQWTGLATISNVQRFTPGLVKLVDDYPQNKELVERVTETIGTFKNREDVPALTDLVLRRAASRSLADQRLVASALQALDEIRDPRVVEVFLNRKGATKYDEEMRRIALSSISEAKRFVPGVIEITQKNPDDEELCVAAASSIENIDDERDVAVLIDLVEKRTGSKQRMDKLLVTSAIGALANIKNQQAVEWALKREDLFFSQIGADMLGRFGVKVLPRLLEIAQNQNDKRCENALYAIANMNDPAAAPTLVQLVTQAQYSPAVKEHAIRALQSMEAKGAEGLDVARLETVEPHVGAELALLFVRNGSPMQKEKVLAKFCAPGPMGNEWFIKTKKPELLEACIDSLQANKDYRHDVLIEKFLAYGDADVKIRAAEYLASADYERYSPQILKLLKYSARKLTPAILTIFIKKKESKAVASAEQLLEDPDDETRVAAARLLKVITGKDYAYQQTSSTQTYKDMYENVLPEKKDKSGETASGENAATMRDAV